MAVPHRGLSMIERDHEVLQSTSMLSLGPPQTAEYKGDPARADSRTACAIICCRPLASCWFQVRRDVRVVEGARLESEVGERHEATSERANTHAISGLSP